MRAFIFPGQGSQAVGMGRALGQASAAARAAFEEVDHALGQSLFRLMTEGPPEDLLLTENAQPAIMANALATLRMLEREGGVRLAEKADYVAGHSLGEYSALCAAEAFDLSTTARLLKTRGLAMQDAVPVGEGAMAALLGADLPTAEAIAGAAVDSILAEGGEPVVCEAANDNGGGQVVISGHRTAVERAVELAKARGVRRAMLLPVSAPFHCALMAPAAEVMADALGSADLRPPEVPLIANVSAERATDPDEIRGLLVRQVTGTVRWRESVLACTAMGVDGFLELGAGKVLSGLVRRISPDCAAASAGTPGEIEAMLRLL